MKGQHTDSGSVTRDDLVAATTEGGAADRRQYGDRARVVSEIPEGSVLETVPTVVCCPNCGEIVSRYRCGLPPEVPYFAERCRECEVELRTWCGVAVDAAYCDVVKASTVRGLVQRAWDRRLWSGITNSKGKARTDEYTDRFEAKATAFGWDWEVRCPLCRRGLTELKEADAIGERTLDYHHWSEEPDRGICLCRECHDIIGFDMYDSELEERAESWGFESPHNLQIVRIALREAAVSGRRVGPCCAEFLVQRYNLPDSVARVEELLDALRREETLQDRFITDQLVSGLDDC